MGKVREAGIKRQFCKMEGIFRVQKRIICYAGENIIRELQHLALVLFLTLAPGKPILGPLLSEKENLCNLPSGPSIVSIYLSMACRENNEKINIGNEEK